MNTEYHKAICEEMNILARDNKVIFLGQQVASENFYGTLEDIPLSKRIEMPVAEEMQTGLSIGLALEGFLPVSIYQRMDFLPRACDQLVNHLNLIPEMSRGLFKPKVIIRTTIGSKFPLDVGPQHRQDLTEMFKAVLKFPVLKVTTPQEVHHAYGLARSCDTPIMIIEVQDLYKDTPPRHKNSTKTQK
jgi:pyruvate/2-oxoglutarate/acetoin dehydrogenase E1 component